MAEDQGKEGTEAPTPHRREEAREQGLVAISSELSGGLLLLTGVAGLWFGAGPLAITLLECLRVDLGQIYHADLGPDQAQALLTSLFSKILELLGYFFGLLFVTALGVGALQVGFQVTPSLLAIHWEKLSPSAGWARVISLSGGMRGFVTIAKVLMVVMVCVWVLYGRSTQILLLGHGALANAVSQAWDMVLRLALAVAGVLVMVGIIDYLFQRWRHEKSLLMTRQELKEEYKREEGDPQIKARLRKLQREVSRRKVFDDVPQATVVITNPTHLAIALRYDRGTMVAPKVLAKGAGYIAKRIVELARKHAVPVVERKQVARALFKAVNAGQEIPVPMYVAIAEILAYVYQLQSTVVMKSSQEGAGVR